jgi:hypothetical protein
MVVQGEPQYYFKDLFSISTSGDLDLSGPTLTRNQGIFSYNGTTLEILKDSVVTIDYKVGSSSSSSGGQSSTANLYCTQLNTEYVFSNRGGYQAAGGSYTSGNGLWGHVSRTLYMKKGETCRLNFSAQGNSRTAIISITAQPLPQVATVVPATQKRAGFWAKKVWGSSGCSWTKTGASWTSFNANTTCSGAGTTLTGFATADATQEGEFPRIRLTKYPKGVYVIKTSISPRTDNNGHNTIRVSDGINVSGGNFNYSTSSTSTSGHAAAGSTTGAVLYNPTDREDVTIEFQGWASASTQSFVAYSTYGQFPEITVLYFPDLSEDGIEVPKILPIVDGTVTSSAGSYKKQMRVEGCKVTAAHTFETNDCNTWLDSVTYKSTGKRSFTIKANTFSEKPRCTCNNVETAGHGGCGVFGTTTSDFETHTLNNSAVFTNYAHDIICIGLE